MYGIADLDNCYCSCEKVFRPDLEGKAIVVLSNNDGCVVARSNEAKKMGIKEGTPYFQLAELFPGQKIAVFSSNYELYGELTGRVVSIIRQETPAYFRYLMSQSGDGSSFSVAYSLFILELLNTFYSRLL